MGDIFIPEVDYWEGIYILLAWFVLLWLVARNSGWAELAKCYAAARGSLDDVEWVGWQSGKVDGFPYLRCLWIATTPEGLALKTGPDILLRPGHPSLLLPWDALTSTERGLTLTIKERKITLMLPDSVLAQAKSCLPQVTTAA